MFSLLPFNKVTFWNLEKKLKLHQFDAVKRPISAASFNSNGQLFCYASSYDWSKGCMHSVPGNEIFIHSVRKEDLRPNRSSSN